MSREALQLSFGGPNALEAFAAVLLGERPFEPSEDPLDLAAMARELARDRTERRSSGDGATAGLSESCFRALYGLARERAAAIHVHREPLGAETKPAEALRLLLSLRHRQRAILALRYFLGMGRDETAFVIGATPHVVDEVSRAGLAAIAKAAGSKMDVRRNLRAAGRSIPRLEDQVPEAVPSKRDEPRKVVQLLLAPPPMGVAQRVAQMMRVALDPRPVYSVPLPDEPVARVPIPSSGASRLRRPDWRGLAVAAAAVIIAIAFMGVADRGGKLSGPPLAVIPVAPAVTHRVAQPAAPLASSYVVRAGDSLWTIAGRTLGASSRWSALWRANAGKKMSDGSRFVNANLIRPGWVLTIPRASPAR
jgi:LysM domain-containing protein